MNFNQTIGIKELIKLFGNAIKPRFSNHIHKLAIQYAGNAENYPHHEALLIDLQADALDFLAVFYLDLEQSAEVSEYLAKTFLIDTFPKNMNFYPIVRKLFGDVDKIELTNS